MKLIIFPIKCFSISKYRKNNYQWFLFLLVIFLIFTSQIACSETVLSNQTRGVTPLKKPSKSIHFSGSYRALLIGNNNYQSKKWDDLKTPINDITRLADLLIQRYQFDKENVILLENANRSKILNGLDQLALTSSKDDNVLVYYAGHGGIDELERGYWVPVGSESTSQNIKNTEIKNSLDDIKAKHKLLISDSCFSGAFVTTERSRSREIDSHLDKSAFYRKYSALKSTQALSSGGNQPVFDGGKKWDGHSIFAYHLISLLKANENKFYSANELKEELSKIVTKDTAYTFGLEKAQTPIFNTINIPAGNQGGRFFFIPNDIGDVTQQKVFLLIVLENTPEGEALVESSIGEKVIKNKLQDYAFKYGFYIVDQLSITDAQFNQTIKYIRQNQKLTSFIAVRISSTAHKEDAQMYQGKAEIGIRMEAYQYKSDNKKLINTITISPRKTLIEEWSDDASSRKPEYVELAGRVMDQWPEKKLNHFLRSFEAFAD
jgi:hypothetical protein